MQICQNISIRIAHDNAANIFRFLFSLRMVVMQMSQSEGVNNTEKLANSFKNSIFWSETNNKKQTRLQFMQFVLYNIIIFVYFLLRQNTFQVITAVRFEKNQ